MDKVFDESTVDTTTIMTLPPAATLIDELLVDSGFDLRGPEYEPTREGVVAVAEQREELLNDRTEHRLVVDDQDPQLGGIKRR